jgi:hypothetical protein
MPTSTCDILVVGASLGGVAAALSAARAGKATVLVSGSNWVGGQMTSQGVCTPDDNAYVDTTGSTASYQEFRQLCRQYYQTNYTLSEYGQQQVQAVGHLNLGQCWVNMGFAVEPLVGDKLLKQMLSDAGVTLLLSQTVQSAGLAPDNNSVETITIVGSDGTETQISFSFVLDATDLGDLLPLAGVEFQLGAESVAQTGEPDAAADAPHQNWIQPITYPFALERCPVGEVHTIPEPPNYAAVRDSQNFSLTDGNITGMFVPRPLPAGQGTPLAFWTYRRVVAAGLFTPTGGPYNNDVATINVAGNDYLDDVIPTGDPAHDAQVLANARAVSLCYLYWLQTESPRDAGDGSGTGYPNLRPVTEFWNTPDAISPDVYVREGRRIQALVTIKEQDIVTEDAEQNDLNTGSRAQLFTDTGGIGLYDMDIHANNLGQKEFYLGTKPFQIPLGSLVPIRVTNLLPACKNLGVTHLTNGAYRLHPIEWNVGETSAALAAYCIDEKVTPQAAVQDSGSILAIQAKLLAAGIPIFWWSDVLSTDDYFVAAQKLGAAGVITGTGGLAFSPDEIITTDEENAVSERIAPRLAAWPTTPITRAQAADILAE